MSRQSKIFFILFFSFFLSEIYSSCPNKCSGHGSCGVADKCSCYANFQNGACSDMTCQYHTSWVSVAKANNYAHYYAECSNAGTCDRQTGFCNCHKGYTGSACRRQECPDDCSGYGQCRFIEELAADSSSYLNGAPNGVSYVGWDQEKARACFCDPYRTGPNCAQRMCPAGDDPLTTGQYNMIQYIQVGGDATIDGGKFFLTYFDPYGNKWKTPAITFSTTASTLCSNIQTALLSLPNRALDNVIVSPITTDLYTFTSRSSDFSSSGKGTGGSSDISDTTNYVQCLVKFGLGPGTTGLQYLLGCDVKAHTAGSYPVSTGLTVSGVYSSLGACNVGEYVPTASLTSRVLTEISPCSNRGTCDAVSGECNCFAGHKGIACEIQDALV